jgi:hypothetical protein
MVVDSAILMQMIQCKQKRESVGKPLKIEIHDTSSNSSVQITDNDQDHLSNRNSILREYLAKKYKIRRRNRKLRKSKSSIKCRNSKVQDAFRFINKCLSPMKKKKFILSKSRSRQSSNHSRSSSFQNSPSRLYLNGRMTKTDLYYQKEMIEEIRLNIYSKYRRKMLQKKHRNDL